jgi:hypothetical protein
MSDHLPVLFQPEFLLRQSPRYDIPTLGSTPQFQVSRHPFAVTVDLVTCGSAFSLPGRPDTARFITHSPAISEFRVQAAFGKRIRDLPIARDKLL